MKVPTETKSQFKTPLEYIPRNYITKQKNPLLFKTLLNERWLLQRMNCLSL
jgi:hypothetical protein